MCRKCSSPNIHRYNKACICLDCEFYEGNLRKETFLFQTFYNLKREHQKEEYNQMMEQIQKENTARNLLRKSL